MNYIPQEAKEQIAELMSTIEELEIQKDELIHQVVDKSRKEESNKTMIMIASAIGIIAIALLVYTYLFGPFFGSVKTKLNNTEYLSTTVEELRNENSTYKTTVERLNDSLKNNTVSSPTIKSELIYRVQVGAYKKFKLGLYSSDMYGMLEKNNDGFNKYSLGVFDNYKDALKFKKEIKRVGIKSAFLIAEYKGEEVEIKKAIKLESNQ